MPTKYWLRLVDTPGGPIDTIKVEVLDEYGNLTAAPIDITANVKWTVGGSTVSTDSFIILQGTFSKTKTYTHTASTRSFNGSDPSPQWYLTIPIDYYDGSDFLIPPVVSDLVINHTPSGYPSAHGDLIFVVFESVKTVDPITYPSYKYVCDVYIGDTLVTRLKKLPQPDNLRGVFNVGPIIRSYVSSVFNPTANQLRAQQSGLNEFFVTATMKFGDEYDYTTFTNLTVDSARNYYNHYNGRMLGETSILDDYVDKALSVRPYATPIDQDDDFSFVSFLPSDTDDITLSIKKYTSAGLAGTITSSFTPSGANVLQVFNIAPSAINTVSPGFIVDGVSYYTVEFQTPNDTNDSIFRFDLTCEAIYDVKTLHFLNRFGGFESRNFTKVSKKTSRIEKSEFGKLPYTISSVGAVDYYNSNNVYNETRSVYSSRYEEKLTLNTDLLSDDEYVWLADLVYSPLVYLEDDGYFLPVVISQSNYEFKKRQTDKLTNLTLDIEFGDKFNTQYR